MDEQIRRAIGDRLKEARRSVGLTQAEVAKMFGKERQAVSHWECGRNMPQLSEWYELGLLYGASLDYLVYGIKTVPVSRYGILARALGASLDEPTMV